MRITGLRELQRAFRSLSDNASSTALRAALREIAEPVRSLAEEKASSEISQIGPRWSRMRVGVSAGVVYVAPTSRSQGGSPRPNLAGLLMDRALQPALDEKEPEIVLGIEELFDRLGRENGF